MRDERFNVASLQSAFQHIQAAGFSYQRSACGSALAWIDEVFGGSWSSEAYAGENIVAKRDQAFAGFATYAPRGLRFAWLQTWAQRRDVAIFGPWGLGQAFRGTPLGQSLLIAALAELRALGYDLALIPAVGEERLIAYYRRKCGARIIEEFDPRRWTQARIRTTVLASGNGTNFQAVLDRSRAGLLPLEINALIANKQGAPVLERARNHDVPTIVSVVWDRAIERRETYDERVLHAIDQSAPELVLLLGWMHVLPERFVAAFPNAINIHPAFLPLDQSRAVVELPDGQEMPAFRGAHAVRDALAAGSEWFGASAHRVIGESDRGPILARRPVRVTGAKSEAAVMERVRPVEHEVLSSGIMRWVFERP